MRRDLVISRLLHVIWRFTRPLTMGVRAAAFDQDGRVFLVRHGYISGWYLPGGGVEVGESVRETLEKELREEGNLVLNEPPEIVAVYRNRTASRRDHVVFFVCRNVRQAGEFTPNREITEAGFFSLDALPPGVSDATARRLAELAGQAEIGDDW